LRRKAKLVKLLQELEMRTIGAALLASSLIVSSAFAATDASAPLTPGKPAGVKQAQSMDNTLLLVLGLGVVAGGIALVATGNSKTAPSAVTTTTTAP
jgi:hypothetical protein